MPANKQQHYVPKFLLKQFSSDPALEKERRYINLYRLGTKKFVSKAGIADQCARPYFYSKDTKIEKAITTLEGRTKALLGDLSEGHFTKLSEDELWELRFLVFFQSQRTAIAGKRYNLMHDAMVKSTLEATRGDYLKAKGIDLSQFTIKSTGAQLQAILVALKAHAEVGDLGVCFLRNSRGPDFVLSDHPVIANNQFAETHPYLGPRYCSAIGIANKGLQIFMPIATNLCVAIYDPTTYAYGDGKSVIVDADTVDVDRINVLQAANAESCIYLNSDSPDLPYLANLAAANERGRKALRSTVVKGPVLNESQTRRSQILGVGIPDLRFGIRFSFVRNMNDIDYRGYNGPTFPLRSLVAVDPAEHLRNQIRGRLPRWPAPPKGFPKSS